MVLLFVLYHGNPRQEEELIMLDLVSKEEKLTCKAVNCYYFKCDKTE